jgi:hypothetical protein
MKPSDRSFRDNIATSLSTTRDKRRTSDRTQTQLNQNILHKLSKFLSQPLDFGNSLQLVSKTVDGLTQSVCLRKTLNFCQVIVSSVILGQFSQFQKLEPIRCEDKSRGQAESLAVAKPNIYHSGYGNL